MLKYSIIILCLLSLCSITVDAKVNGSIGALHEQYKSCGLDGIFIEINNQKIGVYLSLVGNTEKKDYSKYYSYSNISLGTSYFIKKKFGIILHCGIHERIYKRTYRYFNPYYKYPPAEENNSSSNNALLDWASITYFTYGTGLLFHTFDNYITLHLKVNYVPAFKEIYFGLGVGIHISDR